MNLDTKSDRDERTHPAWNHVDFTTRALIATGVVALVAVVLFLLWWARYVFFILFADMVFQAFLQGTSDWLHRRTKLPYKWSLGTVVLLLLIILGLAGWLVGDQIASQISQLAGTLPKSFRQLESKLQQSPWKEWLTEEASPSSILPDGQRIFARVTGFLSSALTGITAIVIIAFIGLYGAVEPRLYRRGILHLVPKPKRTRGNEVLDKLDKGLRNWLVVRILSMLIIGVLTGLGLWFLKVPMALALALLAFFLVAIPNLGPLLSAIPAILVAGTEGGMNLAWQTLGLYVAIQAIESYILLPLLQEKTVYLPPILSIMAVLFFGFIGGIIGAFIAAPLLVVLMILVRMLYVEDVLNDYSSEGI